MILERWLSTTYYEMDNFNSIPDYPDCPANVSNSDNFEYANVDSQKQYGRFRAAFVSNQTGNHTFFAVFNSGARIYIKMNPTGAKKILDRSSSTSDEWSQR